MFRTIEDEAHGEITERRSKFIAYAFDVLSKDEAKFMLNEMRRRFHNARHHCHAYRILVDGVIVENQSDDGEPTGTAGAPILDILKRNELVNVEIVVIRYFGGTFLGTAGLSKAYSDAALKAILNAQIVEKVDGYVIEVRSEYEKQKDFEYYCDRNNITILSKDYDEKIKNKIEISKEKYDEFCQKNGDEIFQNLPHKILGRKYIINAYIS